MPAPAVACLVLAAGSGTRLGASRPKAFVLLGGRTLLEHAVDRVRASGDIALVVAVVPAGLVVEARQLLGARDASGGDQGDVAVVAGGPDRSASVAAGLATLPESVTAVLVHDAARCLAPPSLVTDVVRALGAHVAVVPGLPVTDTVKQVDATGRVLGTPDRAGLRAVQTPQGFHRSVLERAHREAAGAVVTDDAGLVERLGEPVHVVPGHPRARKITDADDLAHAGWLLARD